MSFYVIVVTLAAGYRLRARRTPRSMSTIKFAETLILHPDSRSNDCPAVITLDPESD